MYSPLVQGFENQCIDIHASALMSLACHLSVGLNHGSMIVSEDSSE